MVKAPVLVVGFLQSLIVETLGDQFDRWFSNSHETLQRCTNGATYTVPATVYTYPTQEVSQFLKPDEKHTEHL
jgi:hypothetical protein